MNTYRKNAISVGVLFITATVLNVVGNNLYNPLLDDANYLARISANEKPVILGVLLVLLSAFASAGIAIGLYPVLRKHNETLALGSVGFRLIEGMLYIVAVVGVLSLVTLSREYVKSGASNTSLFRASGTLLLAIDNWAGQLSVIAFTVGGLMYYYVFYHSKLVPRWLSIWGFLAAALSLTAALLGVFGRIIPFSVIFIFLQLPIGLQEYVLAFWLIAKGFNSSAIASVRR